MQDQVELMQDLIRVSGESCKEQRISNKLREFLIEAGVPAGSIKSDDANKKSAYGGETGNLIVVLDGDCSSDRIMLSTHMDTIPIAVGSKPEVVDGRLVDRQPGHSLGGDARAGCAILLGAVRRVMELDGRHPPLTFVFFVQEELGLIGSHEMDRDMLGDPYPSMCFNFDGHHVSEIAYSITGAERLNIDISGVSAHSSRPLEGISAAAIEARAVNGLVEDGWHGEIHKSGKYGTSNLGVLNGGKGSNQVMAGLHGLMEARSFASDFKKAIIEEWKNRFLESVNYFNGKSTSELKASVQFSAGPFYDPFTLEKDSPVVTAASDAVRKCGFEPALIEDMGGQDTNNIVAAGIPTVGVGTGLRNAHAENEYVDLSDFEQCCRLAELLVAPG